jgi:hypothetical protein
MSEPSSTNSTTTSIASANFEIAYQVAESWAPAGYLGLALGLELMIYVSRTVFFSLRGIGYYMLLRLPVLAVPFVSDLQNG